MLFIIITFSVGCFLSADISSENFILNKAVEFLLEKDPTGDVGKE